MMGDFNFLAYISNLSLLLSLKPFKKKAKQAEAEVVPSSSLVQFKIESYLVCLRFVKFVLD